MDESETELRKGRIRCHKLSAAAYHIDRLSDGISRVRFLGGIYVDNYVSALMCDDSHSSQMSYDFSTDIFFLFFSKPSMLFYFTKTVAQLYISLIPDILNYRRYVWD